MIGIEYNGIFFDLYPGTTISVELNNPIFDNDFLKGGYSFPFKIPLTPLNRQLLNFPDEPGSTVDFKIAIIVNIYVDGLGLFPKGELNIKTAFETYAEVFVLIGVSTFAAFANGTKVADLMDYVKEVLNNDGDATDRDKLIGVIAEQSLLETVDSLPYIFFPVINDGNYPKEEVTFQSDQFEYDAENIFYNLYVHNRTSETMFYPVESIVAISKYVPFSMCPFFYVSYVMRKILAGAQVEKNIFDEDAELKTLCLLNNFCLDNYIFEVYDVVNGFNIYKKTQTNGRNIEAKNHVPDMTIADFLMGLKNFFCLYLYKDPFKNTIAFDSFNSLLDAAPAYNWTAITNPKLEISQEEGTGIAFQPEANGDKIISETPSLEKEKVVGMSAVLFPVSANPGDLWYRVDHAAYYKWNGTAWEIWGNGYNDYFINPRKLPVKPAFTACPNTDIEVEVYGDTHPFNLPQINTPGSYFKRTKYTADLSANPPQVVSNPNIIKLCFYRGMTAPDEEHHNGLGYPLGSSNNYYLGAKIADYSLAFMGFDGLFEKWWKKYLRFRANVKVVKTKVNLDLATLINLDMRKKVQVQEQQYFIKKIVVQLPLTKPADVELWKDGGLANVQPVSTGAAPGGHL